nr:MAG TPA: hypothetical protein [Caudoviricetes sp.]
MYSNTFCLPVAILGISLPPFHIFCKIIGKKFTLTY